MKMSSTFRLASGGDDIKLWDCDGFILEKQFNPHSNNISSICWSHDNSVLTSASTSGDKIVMTYPDKSAFTYTVGEKENITCVAFNSTSRYVMGGSPTGVVHIWDLKSKTLKKTYQDHKGAISALQFNWNDSVIASGSETGEILLYNVVSGIASSPLTSPKPQAVRKLQYSHFKKSLLGSCSDSGGVFLWDANKRQLLNSFTTSHMAPATAIAFSPLNEMLLMSVGLDKRIVCYDVQGKAAVQTMLAESPLTSVDLMHDGVTLAVGSTRGKIYIFDLRKGSEPMKTITGHKSSVQGLCFQYKTGKSSESNKSKQFPAASRKSQNISNNNTVKSTTKVNGVSQSTEFNSYFNIGGDERNNLLQTSPANLQVYSVPQHDADDIYSPIRETVTTKTPVLLDGAGDTRSSQGGRNSTISNFADSMFSPIAEKSTDINISPAMNVRTQPIGASFPQSNSSQPINSLHTNHSTASDLMPNQKYFLSPTMPANDHLTSLSPPTRLQPDLTESKEHSHSHTSSVPLKSRSSARRLSPSNTTAILVTPPEAGPSDPSSHGATALPGLNARDYTAAASSSIQPFHTQFIRNMIDDALDEFRDQMRQDVLNLHMDMLKQFQIQQEEMRSMLQQHSLNDELITEIERLKEENKRLKKTF